MFYEDLDPIVAMGIGHKITKKEIREFVKTKLATDKAWTIKALLKIFERQTDSEREFEVTNVFNKIGFTGIDGKLLSSFAKQYKNRGYLSPKQMNILYKKMPKYWMQILSITDMTKLERLIRQSLIS